MSFKSLIAACLGLILINSIHANAFTIDFEAQGTQGGSNELDYDINGIVFNYTMDVLDIGPDSPWSQWSPAHSGQYVALNNHSEAGGFWHKDNETFTLNSLWLKGWYDVQDGRDIYVVGWLGSEKIWSKSILSDSTKWQEVTGIDAPIHRVSIYSWDYSLVFLLDDIRMNEPFISAPVPEPSTYAMLALGLGVMGFAARRRKYY